MIICRNVSAGYDDSLVLKGITVKIRPGELIGVLGPNGSGKTTFLKCLARLMPLKGGKVELNGHDIHRGMNERDVARKIALVPQEEAIAFPLTVREMVALGRTPYIGRFGWMGKADVKAVDKALREMDMEFARNRGFGQLSGGERKRVVIARALAQEARRLLLDEPTAHLDVSHALELFSLLRRLAADGRTVLVASHEIWQLARYCDRLFLFDQGRLLLDGSPAEVLRHRECSRTFKVRLHMSKVRGILAPVVLEKAASDRGPRRERRR